MKPSFTNIANTFDSELSAIKTELTKYRQPNKTRPSNQSQNGSKLPISSSTKTKALSRDMTNTELKVSNPCKASGSKLGSKRPSFSIFLPKNEETKLTLSNLPIASALQGMVEEGDRPLSEIRESKNSSRQKVTASDQQKEPSHEDPKKGHKKVRNWSILDSSEKDDGSEDNLTTVRNTEATIGLSYMTTLADDEIQGQDVKDYLKEEIKRNQTERRSSVSQYIEENLILKERVQTLEDKNTKWEAFGKILARCYTVTNSELKKYKMQNDVDKKTIAALKEQVSSLKSLYKAEKSNTAKAIKKTVQENEISKTQKSDIQNLEEKIKALTTENNKLKMQITELKEEPSCIHQGEIAKYKSASEHYKTIAESKFKECSALAEEIICLRTDLDRAHLKYLSMQKSLSTSKSSSSTETSNDSISPNKAKPVQKRARTKSVEQYSMRNNFKGPVAHIATIQKQNSLWEPTDDIDTPLPRTFQMIPSKKEIADE